MKALSLWQPHAQAIAAGLKPYETRHWPTKYPGPIASHAAKRKFSPAGDDWDIEAMRQLARTGAASLVYGAVVCTAELVDCIRTGDAKGLSSVESFWGDWSPGRFAFRLENVKPLVDPVFCRGMQGFFEVPKLEPFAAPTQSGLFSAFDLSEMPL